MLVGLLFKFNQFGFKPTNTKRKIIEKLKFQKVFWHLIIGGPHCFQLQFLYTDAKKFLIFEEEEEEKKNTF